MGAVVDKAKLAVTQAAAGLKRGFASTASSASQGVASRATATDNNAAVTVPLR